MDDRILAVIIALSLIIVFWLSFMAHFSIVVSYERDLNKDLLLDCNKLLEKLQLENTREARVYWMDLMILKSCRL